MDQPVLSAPGELVQAENIGTPCHVQIFGRDTGPVLWLETGLTLMSQSWGWLAPALADRARVIAYDRAGLGWSAERPGLRDATQIAEELDALVSTVTPRQRLILVGHSMGAMFNRAFLERNRDSVAAMIWLDPAHPDQMRNRSLRRRLRSFLFSLESANLLASKNLPRLQIPLIQQLNGLPQAELNAMRTFLRTPSHLRTSAREARSWEISADQIRHVRLSEVPLMIISAQKHSLPGWKELQANLSQLSAHSTHITFTEASHLSLLACREHAERATAEIRGFLNRLQV